VTERELAELLTELVERIDVPGAVAVIRDGDRQVEAAAGLARVAPAWQHTPDVGCLVGSITKTYTTTLILELVEQGALSLDTRLVEVLPELEIGGRREEITILDCLTHRSGLPSDLFDDLGRGDDCLERYVAHLRHEQLEFDPGTLDSYSNGAFSVLGRVVEKRTGKVFDRAFEDGIARPLGLERTTLLPELAIRHPVAIGHVRGPSGWEVLDRWGSVRTVGPEGLVCAPAREVLAFARAALGLGERPLLAPATVRRALAQEVAVPQRLLPGTAGWGLCWWLRPDSARPVAFHQGYIAGQQALVEVAPESDRARVICVNTDDAEAGALVDALVEALGPLEPAASEPAAAAPINGARPLEAYAGRFERTGCVWEVTATGGALQVAVSIAPSLVWEYSRPARVVATLEPLGGDVFAAAPRTHVEGRVMFDRFEDGRAGLLRHNARIQLRAA
jgi:CubicO group peptidase (beta-lactamase class C family)